MVAKLRSLIERAEAFNEDAGRLSKLTADLQETRAAIIGEFVDIGILVTEARKFLAKIDCTVTLPDGAETTGEREAA